MVQSIKPNAEHLFYRILGIMLILTIFILYAQTVLGIEENNTLIPTFSTYTGVGASGGYFTVNETINVTSLRQLTGDNGSKLEIYNATTATKIREDTCNAGFCTITNGQLFYPGTFYLVLVNRTASETLKYKALSMPYDSGYVNFHKGYNSANDTTNWFVFKGITFTIPTTETPITYKSYIITTNQYPTDINTSFAGTLTINASITGDTPTTNGTAIISSKVVTSLHSCNQYYQTTCFLQNNTYINHTMTKINNSYFTHDFDDTDYYPGYYPGNYSKIQSTVHTNYSLWNNNYIKFNVFNMSTVAERYFIDIEIDAYNLSNQPLNVWYCNSSYSTGNPVSNNNCELIDAFTPIGQPHTHNKSRHYAIPISITITKTQNSSFLFVAGVPQASGWKIGYINDSAYNNLSFQIGNYISWTFTYHLFDIHLHEYRATDYFNYYVTYNDSNVTINTSTAVNDWYNITNFPPNVPIFYNPCNITYTLNSTGVSVFVNWSQSQDLNNDSITYYYSIIDQFEGFVYDETTTKLNTTVTFTDALLPGLYYNYMEVCDSFNSCDASYGCSFTLCINDWEYQLTPCINGVRLINYTDANSCPIAYDLPTGTGTYMECEYTTHIQYDFNDEQLIIIVLLIFIVISIIVAVTIFPYAFLITAMLFIFLMLTFILYDYPGYLMIGSIIMSILFVIIAFFSAKVK